MSPFSHNAKILEEESGEVVFNLFNIYFVGKIVGQY